MRNYKSRQTKYIAFVHHKGGTGKTTCCINISGWLHKMGHKVLVVDLDPQGNATAGLGVDVRSVSRSIVDVLLGHASFEECVLETESGLYLVPATISLLAAEAKLAQEVGATHLLKDKLENCAKYFDYILIDAPPGSNLLMVNSIVAAKNIIIPIDAGIFGFETLETLNTLLLNLEAELDIKINVLMTLLKSYSSSWFDGNITHNIKNCIADYLTANGLSSCKLFTIPFSNKVYRAQMAGLPISHHASYSKVGRTFQRIAKEIVAGE